MLRRRFEIALVRLDEGQEFFDRPPNLADQSMDAVYRQSPRTVICACLGVPSVAMQRARRTIWLRSARPETRKCQRQIRAQAGHGWSGSICMVGTIMVDVVRLCRRRQPSPDSTRPAAVDSRDGASRSGRSPRAPASTRRRRPRIRRLHRRRVYGLDLASGKKVWEYEAASPVTSYPAVTKGKVVVATTDGQVICFG